MSRMPLHESADALHKKDAGHKMIGVFNQA
jgi:hypothetical protein